jgi:hypothetical protein
MAEGRLLTITVGVTGASGAILAQKALQLLEADARVGRVHLVVTETGLRLFAEELAITGCDAKQLPARILAAGSRKSEVPSSGKIEALSNKDVGRQSLREVTMWMRWWLFPARWGRWGRLRRA